jgi:hypothetical protein
LFLRRSDIPGLFWVTYVNGVLHRVCNVCNSFDYFSDSCPNFGANEYVNTVGFPNQPQKRYNPYSNTYSEGWRDHPNFIRRNQGGK